MYRDFPNACELEPATPADWAMRTDCDDERRGDAAVGQIINCRHSARILYLEDLQQAAAGREAEKKKEEQRKKEEEQRVVALD